MSRLTLYGRDLRFVALATGHTVSLPSFIYPCFSFFVWNCMVRLSVLNLLRHVDSQNVFYTLAILLFIMLSNCVVSALFCTETVRIGYIQWWITFVMLEKLSLLVNACVADPDLGSWIWDLVPFWPLDPGSRMGKKSRSGSGIWNEQPGSYFPELRNHFLG